MNIKRLTAVCVFNFVFDICMCQFYTSSYGIEKLLDLEQTLLESLNGFFERQQKNGITFDTSVINFVKLTNQKNRETNRSHDLDNPLATFHLLRRTVNQWQDLKKNLSCDATVDECPILTGEDVINVVLKREGSKWPTDFDLRLAAKAVLNTWNVYDLDLDEFINGKIDIVKEQPLSADDIYYIANVAKDSLMFFEAITWFEYLLARIDEFSSYTFSTSALIKRLASSYREYGSTAKAIDILETYSKKDPQDKTVARDLAYFRSSKQESKTKAVVRFGDDDTSKKTRDWRLYEELCRNASQGKSVARDLLCHLVPLFRWYGVAKVELLSMRPRIELIYDVLNTTETTVMQSYGEVSILFPVRYFAKNLNAQQRWTPFSCLFGSEAVPFKRRSDSSDQTLISGPMCEGNNSFPLLVNISKRIEQMTRFNIYPERWVSSSECYKMVNEGLGGVQKPVVDYWKKGQLLYADAGNRQATVMLQLSDVAYGGYVVFPKLNLHTPVVKGSALVWWNLKADGNPNPRALHINCPVVVGSQWAAFKHILYNNQLFRRPFDLQ